MRVKNKLSGIKVGKFLKYGIFATNMVAILMLLLSVLAWIVSPSKIGFIPYLGLVFPIILFVNIIYLLLWVISFRWKYALIQFVALLICWSPIFTCFPIHSRTKVKDIPENSFKVLSYNVRSFNWLSGEAARKNPIIDYFVKSKADIICIQELAVSTQRDKRGIISEEELSEIMKDYPYHSIIKLGTSRGSLVYGIACYSKYPIQKSSRIPIESPYNGSAMFELKVKGKTVTLINNHLESNRITAEDKKLYRDFIKGKDNETLDGVASNIHNRLGVAYKVREKQANVIRNLIDEQQTDATIVCGDFNDTPISYVYRTIKGDLEDSYVNTGLGQGITYHENKFWFRIDYIMHSPIIKSYNCTVDKIKYSDHYPIWTYLAFKNK